jgi:hypothetical protein
MKRPEAMKRSPAMPGARQGPHMQVGHVAHVHHAKADVGAGAHAAVQQLAAPPSTDAE